MPNGYTHALKLVNNKLTITEMVQAGYQAYVYPQPVIDYACKVLTLRELKLYLQISGQANGFTGAMKFYCNKANIKSNHYSEIVSALEKKGFIRRTAYESIEVLYPTESEEEYNEQSEIENPPDIISQIEESTSPKIDVDILKIGNHDSQIYDYNRAENNYMPNKDTLPTYTSPQTYKQKVVELLTQIGKTHSITSKVFQQLEDLREKGLTYEFIYRALTNKKIDDFSMGIGLLFTESYQEEIRAKIDKRKLYLSTT